MEVGFVSSSFSALAFISIPIGLPVLLSSGSVSVLTQVGDGFIYVVVGWTKRGKGEVL